MSNSIYVNDLMSICSPPQLKSHYSRTPNTNDSMSANKENLSTESKKFSRFKNSTERSARPPLTQKKTFGLRVRKAPLERSTEPIIKSSDFVKRLNEDCFYYNNGLEDLQWSPQDSKLKNLPR